jgi:hypothetical protein
VLHCGCVLDVTNCNVGAVEKLCVRGVLCIDSAGNSESGYTKNSSFCFLGFVIDYGIVCYICIV